MQHGLKHFALSALVIFGLVTSAEAATLTFTATRVLEVSSRNTPAQKLLHAPIRVNSDQRLVLVPRPALCADGYCSEQVHYSQLKLVDFQRIGEAVTRAKAQGRLPLDNGDHTAVVEIVGNTDQTARMTITTTSPDGRFQSQATLEGYFTQTVF